VKAIAAALALALSGAALAVPPDLKVSSDDLNEAGEQFFEVQANMASRAGPNAADPRTPFQFLGEYSYGITDHWQFALKLPFARDDGIRGLGATGEIRYLGPHDREQGGYWGLDVSLGRTRVRAEDEYSTALALSPVVGYRAGRWHLAGNFGLGLPHTGSDRRAGFGAAAKAGYRVGGKSEVGLEYFLDAGPFRHWNPRQDRTEYLLLAWDKVVGNELNLAIGRGLTDASERWIAKVVYSFPLQ
jgi:hypothetical protein